MFHPIVYLVVWTCQGALNAYFAQKRGRDPIIWFVIGLFIGLFGILALFLLPTLSKSEIEENEIELEVKPIQTPNYKSLQWFYLDVDHAQHGPVTYDMLQSNFNQDIITEDTYVWSEEMTDWQKVKDLDLFTTESE